METEGKWQKRNKHKQTYFWGKRETITRRVKQGDTQKGEIEKKNEKEKTQQKKWKTKMKKTVKKKKINGGEKNNKTKEEKQEVRNKEGSTQTMKQQRQDEIDTNIERDTER